MENLLDSKNEIIVQNAEGEANTTATIIHKNDIDYEPKVSVIIPVYNTEKYLRECLDSVVNQTLKEIEIICVDDGSTDSSLEILKEYALKDNRFTIITQENLHAGVARNAGLTVAKGEFLNFLDADDLFELNMLEEMYNKASSLNLDMLICNASKFDSKTKEILNVFGINNKYIPTQEVFSIKDIKANWSKAFIPAAWNKMYNTNFIKKHNIHFQKIISCNDIGFTLCVTAISQRISVIPKVFVYYRKGIKNCISASRGKKAYNIILAYDYVHKFLNKNGLDNYVECLNETITSNIQFEAQNCTFFDLIKFKNKTKKYFGENWYKYKSCFKKDSRFKKLYQNIFSIKNGENKSHKVIRLLGIKLKIKIKNTTLSKTADNEFKTFIYHTIKENSVLLVELNQFHGECLPGMAKYFIDLGYNVDVLLNKKEYALNPFANFNSEKISLYQAYPEIIKNILCSDIVEKYEHLYINSDRIYNKSINEYLGDKFKYPTGKIITMCHHAEMYDELNNNTNNIEIASLVDLPVLQDKKYKVINTHYFKDITKHNKNEVTKFIVVGNIESSRKNHNLLIDTVYELITNNITNFKIIVISRLGKIELPERIKNHFIFKSNLPYGQMYKELENADFLLTLFDPENTEHDRYLTIGASGSYQLMYGFNTPGLIPHKFQSAINGFNNANSIGYNENEDLLTAMKRAIEMSNDEYLSYTENLNNTAKEIYNKSLNNLKEILHIEYKYPANTFVSLGVNCFNRVVLTRHNLKRRKADGEKSLPFDLCVCPLASVIKCIENDFSNYFDNLQYDNNKRIWANHSLKITYNHDIDCSPTNKAKLVSRYSQRIENFRELLDNNTKKQFVISVINPLEDEHLQINKLYKSLKSKCKADFKLSVVIIAKDIKFNKNELNKNILFKHIPHPYPNFWGEWFKGEYFNSPEGKMFEKEYIRFIEKCADEVYTNVQ